MALVQLPPPRPAAAALTFALLSACPRLAGLFSSFLSWLSICAALCEAGSNLGGNYVHFSR